MCVHDTHLGPTYLFWWMGPVLDHIIRDQSTTTWSADHLTKNVQRGGAFIQETDDGETVGNLNLTSS